MRGTTALLSFCEKKNIKIKKINKKEGKEINK